LRPFLADFWRGLKHKRVTLKFHIKNLKYLLAFGAHRKNFCAQHEVYGV